MGIRFEYKLNPTQDQKAELQRLADAVKYFNNKLVQMNQALRIGKKLFIAKKDLIEAAKELHKHPDKDKLWITSVPDYLSIEVAELILSNPKKAKRKQQGDFIPVKLNKNAFLRDKGVEIIGVPNLIPVLGKDYILFGKQSGIRLYRDNQFNWYLSFVVN